MHQNVDCTEVKPTCNVKDMVLTVNGHVITGFSDEDLITVKRDYVRIPAKPQVVTIKLNLDSDVISSE